MAPRFHLGSDSWIIGVWEKTALHIARRQDRPFQAVLPDWGSVFEIPLQSPQRQNQGGGLGELSSSFQLQSGKKEMGLTGKVTFTPTMGMCDEVCDSRSPKGTGGLSLRQPAQGLGQPKGPRCPGEPGRGLEGEALGCGPWVGCVLHSVSPESLAWGWAQLLSLQVNLTWPRAALTGPATAHSLRVSGKCPAFRLLPGALWVTLVDTVCTQPCGGTEGRG